MIFYGIHCGAEFYDDRYIRGLLSVWEVIACKFLNFWLIRHGKRDLGEFSDILENFDRWDEYQIKSAPIFIMYLANKLNYIKKLS